MLFVVVLSVVMVVVIAVCHCFSVMVVDVAGFLLLFIDVFLL